MPCPSVWIVFQSSCFPVFLYSAKIRNLKGIRLQGHVDHFVINIKPGIPVQIGIPLRIKHSFKLCRVFIILCRLGINQFLYNILFKLTVGILSESCSFHVIPLGGILKHQAFKL